MKITTVRVDDDGDEVFEEKEMTITAAAAAVAFDHFKKNKKEAVALANKEAAERFSSLYGLSHKHLAALAGLNDKARVGDACKCTLPHLQCFVGKRNP